jgi:hypothetical protein
LKTPKKIDRNLKAALKKGDAKRIAAALEEVVTAARSSPGETTTIPDGFLRLSTATHRLAQGIWGGFRRPAPVRTLKKKPAYKRSSLGFGPWREEAGKRVRKAAIDGKLTIYVFGGDEAAANNLPSNPVVLRSTLIRQLIPARKGLPDRTIRSSLKFADGDTVLFRLLQFGILLVRPREFNDWYRSERARGKWASQHSRLKPREGRPSKQTESLRSAVMTALREKKTGVAALCRRLLASGRPDVPSRDTLARLVDQLYAETGEPEFRRTKRSRRK